MSAEISVFHKPSDLMAFLQRSRSAVEMALPKHLNPDRMLRLALTCFSTTPALRKCTGQSILASVVVASQIGLEPGVAGQGYLIPYGDKCTFVPGWQGLVGLLNNSGRATAWTGAVFEGDVFDFQLGSAPRCAHIPGPNFGDADKITWVYACGKVNGSEQPVVEAWPVSRVWKHRDRFNKVGQRHYSYQHPEMYARKVVLLQVLKYMPRSIELNNAISAADAAEIGHSSRVDEGVVVDVPVDTVDAVAPPPKLNQTNPATGAAQTNEPERQAQGDDAPALTIPPEELPADATELLTLAKDMLDERGIEYADALRCLKARKKCGVACKQLNEVARSGMEWIVRNPGEVVEWVNANQE